MIVSFMRETATRLRPSATLDDYGNDVLTYVETDVQGVAVLPMGGRTLRGGGSESVDARDTVVSARILIAPIDSDIQPTDRVRYAGVVYDVEGEPEAYTLTSLQHIAVRLTRVTG